MIDPPRTTDHAAQVVYDGSPWLTVARHRITTPDEVDRTHHAVRLNPVATVTAVDEHGRALLMRRHRWIVDRIGFESPGGIIEPGEEHEACARRELREETGFEVADLQLVAVLEPMPGLVESCHYIYTGDGARQIGAPTDAEESSQLVWVPLSETPELLAQGTLLGTGTAVAMLSALRLYGGRQAPDSPGQQLVTMPEPS